MPPSSAVRARRDALPNHLLEILSRSPSSFSLASSLLTAVRSASEPFRNANPYCSLVWIACTTTRFVVRPLGVLRDGAVVDHGLDLPGLERVECVVDEVVGAHAVLALVLSLA